MIIIIRGHIRNSFNDDRLHNMIRVLSLMADIKIYIHTWNVFQSSLSWRKIQEDKRETNKRLICEYFGEMTQYIKHIIIDDDTKIELNGKTDGFINGGPCPIKGWKNYWYGQYRIIDYIKNESITNESLIFEPILNTRFDLFSNSNNIVPQIVTKFARAYKDKQFQKNEFLSKQACNGIDNLFIGNLFTQHKLISNFHYNLDNLVKQLPHTINQERLVFYLNEILF